MNNQECQISMKYTKQHWFRPIFSFCTIYLSHFFPFPLHLLPMYTHASHFRTISSLCIPILLSTYMLLVFTYSDVFSCSYWINTFPPPIIKINKYKFNTFHLTKLLHIPLLGLQSPYLMHTDFLELNYMWLTTAIFIDYEMKI